MGKKGFAISGIVYSMLVLFLILIFSVLGLFGSRKLILDKLKNDVTNKINNETPYQDYLYDDNSGANIPNLLDKMIPIKFDGNDMIYADIKEKWYDYNSKEWANVVVLKNSPSKTYSVGDTILMDDVAMMYVWIPRYKYTIFNASGATISPLSINIQFELGLNSTGTVRCIEDECIDDTNGSIINGVSTYTHPAFTFGDKELSGIWMGKFEMTGNSTTPTILPNNDSMNYNVSTLFTTSLKYNTLYNLDADTHMIKNSEWGAMAYLTSSQYGRCSNGVCEEVRINNYYNSNKILTGCGASSGTVSNTTTCSIVYGESDSYPQSTTGNITGIFDTSGGTYEYVMGVYADSEENPLSGRHNVYNSGFNGGFGCPTCVETDGSDSTLLSGGDSTITELTTGINFPESNYYKVYKDRTTKTLNLGEALWETGKWYSDYNYFINSGTPWFFRGGDALTGTGTGTFSYSGIYGNSLTSRSSRVVLVNIK